MFSSRVRVRVRVKIRVRVGVRDRVRVRARVFLSCRVVSCVVFSFPFFFFRVLKGR
jgi:hypothetical protein